MSGKIEVYLEFRKGHRPFTEETGFPVMMFRCYDEHYDENGRMAIINPSTEDITKLIEDILECGLEQNRGMPELKTNFHELYRSIMVETLGKPPKLL